MCRRRHIGESCLTRSPWNAICLWTWFRGGPWEDRHVLVLIRWPTLTLYMSSRCCQTLPSVFIHCSLLSQCSLVADGSWELLNQLRPATGLFECEPELSFVSKTWKKIDLCRKVLSRKTRLSCPIPPHSPPPWQAISLQISS